MTPLPQRERGSVRPLVFTRTPRAGTISRASFRGRRGLRGRASSGGRRRLRRGNNRGSGRRRVRHQGAAMRSGPSIAATSCRRAASGNAAAVRRALRRASRSARAARTAATGVSAPRRSGTVRRPPRSPRFAEGRRRSGDGLFGNMRFEQRLPRDAARPRGARSSRSRRSPSRARRSASSRTLPCSVCAGASGSASRQARRIRSTPKPASISSSLSAAGERFGEQARHRARFAERPAGGDADAAHVAVDAEEQQLQPARPLGVPLKQRGEIVGELGQRRLHRLGGDDRAGEAPLDGEIGRREARRDRLARRARSARRAARSPRRRNGRRSARAAAGRDRRSGAARARAISATTPSSSPSAATGMS